VGGVYIDPNKDGITHINIYSQGKTELGQMLSNFYKFPINTKDGNFMSVEGYWYWMGIEDCPEKERLRSVYGFNAKKLGKEILQFKSKRVDDNFENKILNDIWYKFKSNTHLLKKEYWELPLEHYYNFGGCIRDVKKNYLWMIEGIEKMRKHLVDNN